MEKPRKRRLVSRKEYLKTRWTQGAGYSLAIFLGLCGVALMLGAMYACFLPVTGGSILFIGFLSGFCFAFLSEAETAFANASQMEAVELITQHNAKDLPATETLVRGSHRPSTDAQAELLRAVGEEPGTPKEELLRAAQDRHQD